MSISLNDYQATLFNKILVAGSQEEVKILIDNSLKTLKQNKADTGKVAGFVNKNISQLETLNPMNMDALQWSNTNMARIYFQHIKRKFSVTLSNE